MAVSQGTQDVVFGINRFHHHPLSGTIIDPASDLSNFGNPWESTLNGHPSVQGKSTENTSGHSGGVNVWYDLQTSAPSGRGKFNFVGIVNAEWQGTSPLVHEDLKVTVGTSSNATGTPSNVFNPSTAYRRLGQESSTGKTWMLQLTDVEHANPESPSTTLLRFLRVNYESYPSSGRVRWIAVGEVFVGSLYHPPPISWDIGVRIRPSFVLTRSRDGWSWSKRIRSATREYTLRWEGLTIEERIELEQFAMNAGNPWYADDLVREAAPRPNLADFGAPMVMSLNQDGFSTDDVVVRNAMYVVLDPSSVAFRQNITGRWSAQMKFLEVV